MGTLTHSGSRYLGMRSAIALAVAGDISLGLRITALPKVIRLESNIKSKRNVTRGDGREDGGQGEQEGEVCGKEGNQGKFAGAWGLLTPSYMVLLRGPEGGKGFS